MKIAIAYNFNDRDWFGGRNYFASLFNALREVSRTGLELLLVMGHKTESSLPQEFPWVQTLRTPLMDRMQSLWLLRQLTLRTMGTDPLLESLLKRHGVDLLSHSTQFSSGSRILSMPWLYDFQFMHLPELWTPKQILWSRRRYADACRHGDAVIVSSEDAGRDLATFAPGHRKPVYVLPFVSNPVDFNRLPSAEDIRARYQLPSAYFHLPNQFWANKNHRLAVDALALLRKDGIDATIACTGKTFDGRMPHYFDELMAYCRTQDVEDRFRVLGTVSQTDLQGLMANACGVINPSRFEGWSTTVEEAKTLQKPLLLADIAVHREQAPRLGRFFAVDDAQMLADHMATVLSEPQIPLDRAAIEADYLRRLRAYGDHYLNAVNNVMQQRRPA